MTPTEALEKVKEAMENGDARLEVVRLLFNPVHPWGVQFYARSRPNGKYSKVMLLLPNEGETVGDLLKSLGDMADPPVTKERL